MPHVTIKIHEKGDAPVEIGEVGAILKNANLETFVILESGMVSGKTSVVLHFKSEGGEDYILQSSAEIINAMHAALQGAEQRFRDKRIKDGN